MSCASMALSHWSMSCAITQDRLHPSQSFLQHYWFRARHMRYPRANCGSEPPQTRSKWRPNALAIDACDRTRVTTTRHLSRDLAFFMGTNHTNREIGTAITSPGLGTTFLAIVELRGECAAPLGARRYAAVGLATKLRCSRSEGFGGCCLSDRDMFCRRITRRRNI